MMQAVVTSFKPNLAGFATMLLIYVKASKRTISIPGSAALNCASAISRLTLKPKLNAVAAPRTSTGGGVTAATARTAGVTAMFGEFHTRNLRAPVP